MASLGQWVDRGLLFESWQLHHLPRSLVGPGMKVCGGLPADLGGFLSMCTYVAGGCV